MAASSRSATPISTSSASAEADGCLERLSMTISAFEGLRSTSEPLLAAGHRLASLWRRWRDSRPPDVGDRDEDVDQVAAAVVLERRPRRVGVRPLREPLLPSGRSPSRPREARLEDGRTRSVHREACPARRDAGRIVVGAEHGAGARCMTPTPDRTRRRTSVRAGLRPLRTKPTRARSRKARRGRARPSRRSAHVRRCAPRRPCSPASELVGRLIASATVAVSGGPAEPPTEPMRPPSSGSEKNDSIAGGLPFVDHEDESSSPIPKRWWIAPTVFARSPIAANSSALSVRAALNFAESP